MKAILFYCALLSVSSSIYAQSIDSSLFISRSQVRNYSFTTYEIADSFATLGDSINASRYFLQIDPYWLLYMNQTPQTIDAFMDNCLITAPARAMYKEKFTGIYNTPRTAFYLKFREMRDEDQKIRKKVSNCGDSLSCAVFEKQMTKVDSANFGYMLSYVQQNGWPSLENGAAYAEFLVLHDAKHWNYYLPLMKTAVLKGSASLNEYNNILNRARPSNMEALQKKKNKEAFDISYVLIGGNPTAEDSIRYVNAVKNCGPVQYIYFIYESPDKKDFESFMRSRNYWIAWDILVVVSQANTAYPGNTPYAFLYSPATRNKKKLTIFLVF